MGCLSCLAVHAIPLGWSVSHLGAHKIWIHLVACLIWGVQYWSKLGCVSYLVVLSIWIDQGTCLLEDT